MLVVVIVEVLTSNRKSIMKDRCKKADKVLRKKNERESERVSELFLYFFHIFALDVDVCIVLLCMCV